MFVNIFAGDMLYIPKYWWHQVRSFDNPNIAVGIWFDIFDFQKEFNERDIIDEEHVVQVLFAMLCSINYLAKHQPKESKIF